MNQPEDNLPPPYNPYSQPPQTGRVEINYALPGYHWPVFIGAFVVLFVIAVATYGLTLPFAIATLFGGIRTALVFRSCRKHLRQPPAYLVSAILSPILCFLFLIAAGTTFFFVCAAGLAINTHWEQAWLAMTGAISVAVFAVLYAISVKVSVANCLPITRSAP